MNGHSSGIKYPCQMEHTIKYTPESFHILLRSLSTTTKNKKMLSISPWYHDLTDKI